MGSVATIGLDDLIDDYAALAAMPDSVIDDMLSAKADVIVPAQQKSAQSMLSGKYNTGTLAKSIKRTKSKRGKDGRFLSIYPHGSRTRTSSLFTRKGKVIPASDGFQNTTTTRNAEIGFINEFGTSRQPARPFIDTANKKSEKKAIEGAANVHDAFLKSKNL